MNESRGARLAFGLFLVVTGGLMLVISTGILRLHIRDYWPLFIAVPGIFFLFLALLVKPARGAVFPGTILTLIGLLFLLHNMGMVDGFGRIWPAFPSIVGVAFLMLFLVFPREPGILFPAVILLSVGGVAFAINYGLAGPDTWKWWPVVLVVIGVWSVLRSLLGPGRNDNIKEQ